MLIGIDPVLRARGAFGVIATGERRLSPPLLRNATRRSANGARTRDPSGVRLGA